MANTFTYDILQFHVHNQLGDNENVIYQILYSVEGVNDNDETKTEKIHHTLDLLAPNEEFIPIDELTKEIVLGWIQAHEVDEIIKTQINDRIEEKINPTKSIINPNFN